MEYVKKYWLYVVIAIIVLGSLFLYNEPDNKTMIDTNAQPTIKETVEYIFVDIKGEVLNPGVYKLEKGQRLYYLIAKAGGITDIANTDKVNLSVMLYDEDVIYIPSIYDEDIIDIVDEPEDKLINLNNATLEELQTLPGIGPSTAQKIIDYRKQVKRFDTVEELMEVSGIGETTFNKLKELITV